MSSHLSPKQKDDKSTAVSNHVSLGELVKHSKAVTSFLKHLVKEHSAENLFFLTDVMQFKLAFIEENILQTIEGWQMKFADDIPRSHIVTKYNDSYQRAKVICDKYIRIDSERELNLSFTTRTTIINHFDSYDHRLNSVTSPTDTPVVHPPDPQIYSQRFDEAAREIRGLLKDSFRRFCLTKEYKKFCSDYHKRSRKIQRELSKSIRSLTRNSSFDSRSSDNKQAQKQLHLAPIALPATQWTNSSLATLTFEDKYGRRTPVSVIQILSERLQASTGDTSDSEPTKASEAKLPTASAKMVSCASSKEGMEIVYNENANASNLSLKRYRKRSENQTSELEANECKLQEPHTPSIENEEESSGNDGDCPVTPAEKEQEKRLSLHQQKHQTTFSLETNCSQKFDYNL